MTTLTVENVPDSLYEDLQREASAHDRTVSEQVLAQLEQSTRNESFDVQTYLEKIRRFHEETGWVGLTDEEIRAARHEGRP